MPDPFHDAMILIPGYEELFGSRPTAADLLERIQRYPVAQWLSFLSRLQTLVAPPNHLNVERQSAIVGGLFSESMRQRLNAWLTKFDPRVHVVACAEPPISVLQQLAILHAPDEGHRRFDAPPDRDALVEAILIAWNLMYDDTLPVTAENTLAKVIQQHAWTALDTAPELVARAFYMYELSSTSPSPFTAELRALFRRATQIEMSDYLVGGMAAALIEGEKTPTDIAEAWAPALHPEHCTGGRLSECVTAFHGIRCGTVEQARNAIRDMDGDRPIHRLSLIGLYRYPILDLATLGRFVISLPALSNALMAGIRFALLDAVLGGHLPGWTAQRLNGLWGNVFQRYVLDILQTTFGDRLLRLEESQDAERADCLVVYADRVLVIEIKGSHAKGRVHRGALTLKERESELRDLQIPKAAAQLARTISDLRLFRIKHDRLAEYDWTTTTVVPVVITYERLPLIWKLWPMYERLLAPLHELPLQALLAPCRFLSVDDVEELPSIGNVADLGSLLLRWGYDSTAKERPLSHWLRLDGIEHADAFRQDRIREAHEFLASQSASPDHDAASDDHK